MLCFSQKRLLCFQCLELILLHTASLEPEISTGTTAASTGTGVRLSPGHLLVSAILRDHMHPLYSSLQVSCPNKLVGATLRLLTAMVVQGHQAARDVQHLFNFGYKPLSLLPGRTHRIQVIHPLIIITYIHVYIHCIYTYVYIII